MNKFRYSIHIERLNLEDSNKIMTKLYELGFTSNDFQFIENK